MMISNITSRQVFNDHQTLWHWVWAGCVVLLLLLLISANAGSSANLQRSTLHLSKPAAQKIIKEKPKQKRQLVRDDLQGLT